MMASRPISNQLSQERDEMVALLERRGIRDTAVLRAMRTVPRHLFVQEIFLPRAYDDCALPIACRQTISQPYTVALMTELLRVQRGQKVLEIGTGSGYQACIVAEMGARVFTIERHHDLLEEARQRFDQFRMNIASKVGDGSVGWTEFAPYQRIIVTAGAPEVPKSLLAQLDDGGVLVIPVGGETIQSMMVVERRGDAFNSAPVDGFKFVPLIGKEGWLR